MTVHDGETTPWWVHVVRVAADELCGGGAGHARIALPHTRGQPRRYDLRHARSLVHVARVLAVAAAAAQLRPGEHRTLRDVYYQDTAVFGCPAGAEGAVRALERASGLPREALGIRAACRGLARGWLTLGGRDYRSQTLPCDVQAVGPLCAFGSVDCAVPVGKPRLDDSGISCVVDYQGGRHEFVLAHDGRCGNDDGYSREVPTIGEDASGLKDDMADNPISVKNSTAIDVYPDVVVVVEKEAVFETASQVLASIESAACKRVLLVTGRGYPCRQTRSFVAALSCVAPIVVLTDYDPYGLDIALQYVRACRSAVGERKAVGLGGLSRAQADAGSGTGTHARREALDARGRRVLRRLARSGEGGVAGAAGEMAAAGYAAELESYYGADSSRLVDLIVQACASIDGRG